MISRFKISLICQPQMCLNWRNFWLYTMWVCLVCSAKRRLIEAKVETISHPSIGSDFCSNHTNTCTVYIWHGCWIENPEIHACNFFCMRKKATGWMCVYSILYNERYLYIHVHETRMDFGDFKTEVLLKSFV